MLRVVLMVAHIVLQIHAPVAAEQMKLGRQAWSERQILSVCTISSIGQNQDLGPFKICSIYLKQSDSHLILKSDIVVNFLVTTERYGRTNESQTEAGSHSCFILSDLNIISDVLLLSFVLQCLPNSKERSSDQLRVKMWRSLSVLYCHISTIISYSSISKRSYVNC